MYERVFDALNAGKEGGAFALGLTATPWRPDETDLEHYFGHPRVSIDMITGLRNGFLANVDYRMFTDNINWDALKNIDGTIRANKEIHVGEEKPHATNKKLNPQTVASVDLLLKESPNGIRLGDIKAKHKELKQVDLMSILSQPFAIHIGNLYFHKDNIEDFDEAANIILESLKNQFSKFGGYTSAKLLYSDVHGRLDDFFFDNGSFESEREVYDFTRYARLRSSNKTITPSIR